VRLLSSVPIPVIRVEVGIGVTGMGQMMDLNI